MKKILIISLAVIMAVCCLALGSSASEPSFKVEISGATAVSKGDTVKYVLEVKDINVPSSSPDDYDSGLASLTVYVKYDTAFFDAESVTVTKPQVTNGTWQINAENSNGKITIYAMSDEDSVTGKNPTVTENGVLKFGEFTLKSGRLAPYFINTGNYKTGKQLAKLGEYYAACIENNGLEAETLVGPAYKGIPLSVTTAIALFNHYGKELNYCFDRKEAKDHGEGGLFVGKQLVDGEKVIIIEDVMTSGKALREILPKLEAAANVKVVGMIISVDRMEKALNSDLSAVKEAKKEFGIDVYSVVTMNDIIQAIEDGVIEGKEHLAKMYEYRSQYGAN